MVLDVNVKLKSTQDCLTPCDTTVSNVTLNSEVCVDA
jgi:hypothetical protein